MVVIGVVLLTAMRGAMSLTNSERDLRTKLLAVLTAENRIQELRLAGGTLALGVNQQDCDQAGVRLVCEQTIQATPNPFFRLVKVRVLNSDLGTQREYASLVTVLPTTGG